MMLNIFILNWAYEVMTAVCFIFQMVPAIKRVVSNLVNNITEKAKTGEMIELKE